MMRADNGRKRKESGSAGGQPWNRQPQHTNLHRQGIPKFQALCEAALNDTSLCEAVWYGNPALGGAGTKDKGAGKTEGQLWEPL